MGKKGQALVEFILILPVILIILMGLIDVGNIFLEKFKLNDDLETVTDLYKNNKKEQLQTYIAKEEINYNEENNNALITITLSKNIEVSTPFLDKALGKDYKISVSKTIYQE